MPEDNSKINSKNILQIKCTSGYGQMYVIIMVNFHIIVCSVPIYYN
jgi:hypothetical protein